MKKCFVDLIATSSGHFCGPISILPRFFIFFLNSECAFAIPFIGKPAAIFQTSAVPRSANNLRRRNPRMHRPGVHLPRPLERDAKLGRRCNFTTNFLHQTCRMPYVNYLNAKNVSVEIEFAGARCLPGKPTTWRERG